MNPIARISRFVEDFNSLRGKAGNEGITSVCQVDDKFTFGNLFYNHFISYTDDVRGARIAFRDNDMESSANIIFQNDIFGLREEAGSFNYQDKGSKFIENLALSGYEGALHNNKQSGSFHSYVTSFFEGFSNAVVGIGVGGADSSSQYNSSSQSSRTSSPPTRSPRPSLDGEPDIPYTPRPTRNKN